MGLPPDNSDLVPSTSEFVVVCPGLIELTVFFPHLFQARGEEMDFLPGQAERARSAIFELVGACNALADFDTLQIVHFPIIPPPRICLCMWPACDCYALSSKEWEERTERLTGGLEKKMKDLEEWAMKCLKEPRTGCREGEGRDITLRTIKFKQGYSSVKVEECGV